MFKPPKDKIISSQKKGMVIVRKNAKFVSRCYRDDRKYVLGSGWNVRGVVA